jgi:predicted site-specific integrase-resolvase
MLKGKNLWIIAGFAVVGYYLYKKNMAAKVIAAPSASTNFTGDLGVPEYQNGSGRLQDRQINRIANASPERAARIYRRIASRRGLL